MVAVDWWQSVDGGRTVELVRGGVGVFGVFRNLVGDAWERQREVLILDYE